MANVTAYNAKDCTIMVDDFYITGLGEDMVTGEKDEEMFESAVGAQGDIVVNEVNNTLGTITLAVQPTCPQKGQLLQYAKAGTVFPIWVVNKSINEKFGGSKARIKSYPELTHGAEAEDREFEIQVFDYEVTEA
ncbi:MAG: DUF3277 domain-containing protein [Clostridia bacterium]|nr:DUF3277 domain-containing protein [Clostridia bacterium]